MKQTRTTLKELTAMYRAVLRHGILCNAIALGLIATPAMAETITERTTLDATDYVAVANGGLTFSGISSTDGKGALTVTSGAIDITGDSLSFTGNTSSQHGAALYYKDQTATTGAVLDVANISFANNTSGTANAEIGSSAGAILNTGGSMSILGGTNSFTDNSVLGADADSAKWYKRGGGAIANQSYWNESDHSVPINAVMVIGKNDGSSTNTFANNSSSTNGGAIMNRAVETDGNATLTINGTTTFEKNSAALSGGAIYNVARDGKTATFNLTNGEYTFAGNTAKNGGAVYNEGTMTLTGATFGGENEGDGNTATLFGGAVYNEGTLSVGGEFSTNTAKSQGGAIYNNGTLMIADASFNGNVATNDSGGAIRNNASGTMSVKNTEFTNNITKSYGGAIYNSSTAAETKISDSSFSGNYAGSGGAIYNTSGAGKLVLENTTISGNGIKTTNSGQSYASYGGAIYNYAGKTEIIGGSITGNKANQGGAIYAKGTGINIDGTTIKENQSITTGGGAIYASSTTFNIKNATIDNNIGLNENGYEFLVDGLHTVPVGSTTSGNGGAIYNTASGKTSSVTGGSISHNIASEGGAIYNNGGTINIDGTTFDDNTAIKFAGAIRNNGTLNISDATFTNNVTRGNGGAIYNNTSKTITIDGSNTFSGNKQSVEWDANDNVAEYDANDIFNHGGTIDIISGAGKTNTFAGGFDSDAGSKLNIKGAGTTIVSNALKRHNVAVNAGELHLTKADLTGSTIAVKSGATINTIDDDIKDTAEITLENGANFALDIDFANTKSDTYKINSGDSVNLTRVNLLSALSEVSDTVKLNVSDAGNIAIDSAVADSVKAYTSAGAFSLVGNTADDGTIGLALTGGAGGLDTAVDLTDANIDESIVYQVTTDETFGSAPDTTIARADFVIRGGNNVVTASGADSIKVASDSKVEINDLTLAAFNVAALENAGETTLNNVTLANTNAMAIKNDGFMKINHSNILADVLNRGTLISDPTTYSGVFTNDAGASASFDADTFTSTAVLANSGNVDLTNGVTFASGASITGAGVTNLASGTTHFDNTTSTNTINLASGANFDGALVNNGVLNTQNGAIDAIDGSVSGGVLNIDARLGTTSGIDKFAAGNTGAIKTINILGTEYGTANSVSLEIGDATLDSNLQINGMNYYTSVVADGAGNLVFSDKLINESSLYNKLGSWTGGNYIATNADMTNVADGENYMTVGQALSALDTQLKTVSTAGTIAAGQTGFVTGDAVNTALADKQATITNTSTIIVDGTGLKVADGSIGATQLAANSVSSANIIDGTITFADLNSNMVATSTSVNIDAPSDTKLVTEKAVVAGITNLLADKQAWTDSTLGITSADADAVQNAYAGTNYLSTATTLTGADKALDTAIKNNADAIAGVIDGTTYTAEMENNVKGTINAAAGTGLTAASGVLSVNTANEVADGNTGYVTSDLLHDQGYQTASDVSALIATAATGTGAVAAAIDAKTKMTDDGDSTTTLFANFDEGADVTTAVAALDGAAQTNADAIEKIENGTTVVAKAAADGAGNNIVNTYATKSALNLVSDSVATLNGTGDGSVAKAASDAVATANAYTDARLAALHDNSVEMANAYTDRRIEDLDKNLSAGVAGAVALSSVAVSGVERGEVSVGAGYGYFNGQSAAAFGATMGLSNRWSINAGAGISNADVSFRAGTNYKFKLF